MRRRLKGSIFIVAEMQWKISGWSVFCQAAGFNVVYIHCDLDSERNHHQSLSAPIKPPVQ